MQKLILFSLLSFLSIGSVWSADDDYTLVWSEEFDSEGVNTQNWNFETGGGGWGNQELQYYTNRPENSFIRNQKLVIKVLHEEYGTRNYTSARITTKDKFSVKYGKIEARIKLPKGKGTWPAFWMMPQSSAYGAWPRSGEVDIMEHVGAKPTMISYAMHTYEKNGSRGNNWYNQINGEGVEDDFHVYDIEWFEDRFVFNFDGVKQVTYWNNLLGDYKSWPFDQEFYIILNVAMGGIMGGSIDDAIFNSDVEMEVDYVRVYQKKGNSIDHIEANPLKVFGKPDSNQIIIQGLDTMSKIEVTDIKGRLLTDFYSDNSDLSIDASSFGKGVFIISVIRDNAPDIYKIIL